MFSKQIWENRTVLVTGHTGFKGSWLSIWLNMMGANVVGYALEPYTERDNFVVTGLKDKLTNVTGDVRDYSSLLELMRVHEPEIVFHLAAQSLVRESYLNPKETYDVNIGGTVNVLECCRLSDSVRLVINVTTDKCYQNNEWVWSYRENDILGGYDPYSSSKAASELITQAYRESFFNNDTNSQHRKGLASVRAGNVIGGGDWRTDRLIPDCVRALERNEPVSIRNPNAIRPWQHVLEPLYGYLLLASRMFEKPGEYCEAWNFGPEPGSMKSVAEVAELVVSSWGGGSWEKHPDKDAPYEATTLRLDITKATTLLGWKPKWSIEDAVRATVDWYKGYRQMDMYEFCVNQIESYMESID